MQNVIWCFTAGSGEGRTLLCMTILGWSARFRSIHEGLQSSRMKCVGPQINWVKVKSENELFGRSPSKFVSPLGHHD